MPASPADRKAAGRSDWSTLQRLFPYLWQYKWRVLAALAFMIAAKGANVSVPLLLKELVDAMDIKPGDASAVLVVPLGLLVGYGLLRLSTTLFTELRELVFAKATQGAARSIALETFRHLHALSLRFHLERQTGGMTRDIERGVRGIESLISYSLYSIVPTLIEVAMVLTILAVKFDAWFAWITIAALGVYIVFTVSITEWRTQFRREANEFDSAAHTKAVDSLLNYETVKYFNNEDFEARRYDQSLERLRRARLKSQTTLSLLNTGQQLIIAVGLVAMLWRATLGVVEQRMTLGDLVMINAFMIQLYIPLNFLGVLYREIKQSLTDLDKMFTLMEKEREVADRPGRSCCTAGTGPGLDVHFAYEATGPSCTTSASRSRPARPWRWSALAGKSTLARLLYRFYDVQQGRITIAGQDVREVTQSSVRQAIGIVRRTRCCSTTRSNTTSPMAARVRPAPRSRRRRAPPASTASSNPRPGATRPWWGARTQAVGRREAAWPSPARCSRTADPDLRRGDLRAGQRQRARHPGGAEERRPEQDDPGDRPPPVHGGGRARDPGDGSRAHHRARHPPAAAGTARPLRRHVGPAAERRGRGLHRGDGDDGGYRHRCRRRLRRVRFARGIPRRPGGGRFRVVVNPKLARGATWRSGCC